MVTLFAALAVIAIGVAIITFVLYGRARMKEQEAKEKLYLQIHYSSLFLLLLIGIIFMFFMVETAD